MPAGTPAGGALADDVRAGDLPDVGLVTPNLQHDGHNGKNPTLAVERKILRRCYHTLRELGDAALSPPQPVREAA